MKLPDIEYGAPVQDPGAGALRQVDEAQRQAAGTLAAGFRAFGQELVKTQTHKAAAELQEGLAGLEAELNQRRTVPAQWVRDQLGDQADALLQSAGVREQLTKTTIDQVTGEPVTVERSEIPTWVVAGAIYEKRAKDLMRNASSGISVGEGWQAAFQEAAGPDVTQQRARFAAKQLEAMHQDLKQEQGSTVDALLRLERFGRAVALVEDSKAFDPGEKAILKEKILAQEASRDRAMAVATAADQAFQTGVVPGSRILDEDKVFAALEAKTAGMPPDRRADARSLLKARVSDFNEQRKNQTSSVFAGALQAFDQPGPLQFKTAAIPYQLRTYLTDPANGREAAELWQSLLDKEHAHEMRGRGLANTPTEANWQAYGALVKDIADSPSKYRNMSGDRFTAEVYGKVGPLIGQAMAAYKSAVEPTTDKRVLGGDERRSILEALPPTFRPSKNTQPTSVQGQVWNLVVQRIGERKAKEWEDSKGPVPDAVLKQWVAEEWATGTVKGGRYWGFVNAPGVPKAVAEVKYPGKEWTPDQPGAAPPAGAPAAAAAPPPAAPPAKPGAVVTPAQVPLVHRQRIVQDYRAKYGKAPSGADIVRGYNAGVAAGVF